MGQKQPEEPSQLEIGMFAEVATSRRCQLYTNKNLIETLKIDS